MRTGMTFIALVAAVVVVAAIVPVPLSSQSPVPTTVGGSASAVSLSGSCGSAVTPEEAVRYLELRAQDDPFQGAPLAPPPYCVPIAGHIVRRSDGTGGMSLSQYYQSITDANFYFAPMGIQFYSLGVDYIDSDFYYSQIVDINDINALRSTNVVSAAINVYYTPTLPGLCGISSFTFSSVQGIVMANGCSGVPSNPTTMPHEIGHYLDLFHTHETAFGTELVNGTNCNSAGDLFCDTPADPNLSDWVSAFPGCVYTGAVTDPNGDPYAPDVSQIMSYATPLCANDFSPQSQTKAVNVLNGARSSLLSRGCTPVPAPTLSTVTPPTGFADQAKEVVLVGTNMGLYTTVDFGDGITINSLDTLSADSLRVNMTIGVTAAIGLRDVSVNNAFDPDTLFGGFEVLATPTHYVSPAGADVYPYATPFDAATTLAAALTAAGDGDSVRVDTTTVNTASIDVVNAVALSGGWTDNFTARDVTTRKTTVNLTNNVLLGSTSGPCSIDGFLLQGGRGSLELLPENGNYGGGIRVVNTTATVSNCEIRNCVANAGVGFGGGGGIFVTTSTVTIDNCDIQNNDATRGGGILVYNSSGSISNCNVSNNAVAVGGTTDPGGGGISVEESNGLTISNTTCDGNTGAKNGGGLYLFKATGIAYTGGSISGNGATAASSSGGGVNAADSSGVTITGTTISGNSATFFGGGISVGLGAVATVVNAHIDANTGLLGGGVFAQSAEVHLQHNLVTGNIGTSSNAGMYLQGVTGDVIGNTLDQNTATVGTGGIGLASSNVTMFNNIIANTTGDGVNCSGSTVTMSYNLVYNSSGVDYNSCTPGTGALSSDPLFVAPLSGDYHLAFNSPAIDAGDPGASWNDPDGSRGDMGRYGSHAFTMDRPVYPTALASNLSGSDVVLSWDPNPETDVQYYSIYCDSVSGFVPGPGNFVTTTPDTSANMGTPADTLYYVISAVDSSGYAGGYSGEVMSVPSTSTPVGDIVWKRNSLSQNVPNPFNPVTTINFSLATPEHVTLAVYDVAGRLVRKLVDGPRAARPYAVSWDGSNDRGQSVASGVYFYRLEAGKFTQTRKMVLLK